MDNFENDSNQIEEKPNNNKPTKKKSSSSGSGYIRKISKVTKIKPIIIVIIIIVLAFGILEFTNINPFRMIRNLLFTEASLQSVTVTSLEDTILDIFQVATLEIESNNVTVLEIVPGGFLSPGTITII